MLFIQSHAEPHFELYLLPADAENPGQAPDTKFTKLVIGDRTAGPDCASESAFSQEGQLYFRKDAKNFGQSPSSACEIEHGRFRALFAGPFCPKMQNGRTLPKSKKN